MRRIPIPAKMTFAGENTWKASIWWLVVHNLTFDTYQTNALAKGT